MNALNVIENARENWDEETRNAHGFEVAPGDATLRHGALEDSDEQYRIAQFLDIVQPTDTPEPVRGLIAEYVVIETDAATYEIVQEADTEPIAPAEMNFVIGDDHPKFIYEVERTGIDTFEILLS